MAGRFLPGVPGEQVERRFRASPSDQIESGKFDSPESSAALATNAFGFFLNRRHDMPPLPDCAAAQWPASSVCVESEVRFPWRRGRHPWLDCLITTPSAVIGVESKRFEPFRAPRRAHFSPAYWRPVCGRLLEGWAGRENAEIRAHAKAVSQRFSP